MKIKGHDPRKHDEGLGPDVQGKAIPVGDPIKPILLAELEVQAAALTSETQDSLSFYRMDTFTNVPIIAAKGT